MKSIPKEQLKHIAGGKLSAAGATSNPIYKGNSSSPTTPTF